VKNNEKIDAIIIVFHFDMSPSLVLIKLILVLYIIVYDNMIEIINNKTELYINDEVVIYSLSF
jgi:hypothetical protein